MRYWLLKTEPQNWSWTDQLKSKNQIAEWNGVRNYQASKNLKAMKKNDLCFFYHSGKEKRIIGIVRIIKEHFRDKTDKANKFVSVMVRGEDKLSKPVTLKKIKKDKFIVICVSNDFVRKGVKYLIDAFNSLKLAENDIYKNLSLKNNFINKLQREYITQRYKELVNYHNPYCKGRKPTYRHIPQ